MVDEMVVAQAEWLPQYAHAIDAAKDRLSRSTVKTRTWNGAAYANELAVGGNVNLRSTATIGALSDALDPATNGSGDVMDFLIASGRLATSTGASVGTAELGGCGRDDADCGPAVARPGGYRPGASAFSVSAPRPLTAVLNEAYYPGWTARACADECAALRVGASPEGLLELALPAGEYRLSIEYRTPGRGAGWLLFAAGGACCVVATAVSGFVRRSRTSAPGRAEP